MGSLQDSTESMQDSRKETEILNAERKKFIAEDIYFGLAALLGQTDDVETSPDAKASPRKPNSVPGPRKNIQGVILQDTTGSLKRQESYIEEGIQQDGFIVDKLIVASLPKEHLP